MRRAVMIGDWELDIRWDLSSEGGHDQHGQLAVLRIIWNVKTKLRYIRYARIASLVRVCDSRCRCSLPRFSSTFISCIQLRKKVMLLEAENIVVKAQLAQLQRGEFSFHPSTSKFLNLRLLSSELMILEINLLSKYKFKKWIWKKI